MLPIPPNEWPPIDLEFHQLSDSREKCPICGNVLENLYGAAIGGFSGHEHVHPGPLIGYNCYECMRQFSLDEILLVKEKKTRREALAKNYWKNIRIIFLNPYLYLIAVSSMLISHSFWVGIMAGAVVILLMRCFTKIFLQNKPPDNPKTP